MPPAFICVLVSLYINGAWITESYEATTTACYQVATTTCPDYDNSAESSPQNTVYPIRLNDYQDAIQIYLACSADMTADLTHLSPMPNMVGFYSECPTIGYYQMLAGATASYPYLDDEDRAKVDEILGENNAAAQSASASVSLADSISDSASVSASVSASASESLSQSAADAAASAVAESASASVSASISDIGN